jgi:hypothetical protein
MRKLEYFKLSEVGRVLSQIVRYKLRRILAPPTQPEPEKRPSKQERIAADKQATAAANRRIVEQKIELGRKLGGVAGCHAEQQALRAGFASNLESTTH